MRFENIFKETEENVRLALESMWVPGAHPMRGQIERLFVREPLLAEPVFQSMFGWETARDGSWHNALNPDVVARLGIGSRFAPYEHQARSWKALHDGKSIVVTSGTGSGKTECFMYPVIGDLCDQGNTNAIQALFLYPLNALMEDQKQRLSGYCQPNGLRFAVYNGSTPENRADQEALPCEVQTRNEIRDARHQGTRPQILLTNPSMLEYILVRKKDQQMLQESAGKLRWIVIDEAHTYSGSAAAELSLQIKRILEAFEVSASDVRFACTSATMSGQDGADSLKEFISNLTGQPKDRIEVIDGHRIIPDIDPVALAERIKSDDLPSIEKVMDLRKRINVRSGMSLSEIWNILCSQQPFQRSLTLEALRLLDRLCDISVDGNPLLSLRAHLFMRTVNGLYACGNPSCPGSSETLYGHLTTYKASVCPHCGEPLLEILQCKRCNSFILSGQSEAGTHLISPIEDEIEQEDPFELDDESLVDDAADGIAVRAEQFYMIPYDRGRHFSPSSRGNAVTMDITHGEDGSHLEEARDRSGHWVEVRSDSGQPLCPDCGRLAVGKKLNLQHFRVPLDFLNQTVSPVFLKECAPDGLPWGKYIAFTDSRQGTAISAKTFNIEVERRCCRANTMAKLSQLGDGGQGSTVDIHELDKYPAEIRSILLAGLAAKRNEESLTLHDLGDVIYDQPLHKHLTDGKADDTAAYKAALMRQFIGRRQMYENGAETMGLITLTYPALSDVRMPEELADYSEANGLGVTDNDWRDFLKLTIDFFVRLNNHIQPLLDGERPFVRDANLSRPFTASDDKRLGLASWPVVAKNDGGEIKPAQSRIVILLCAGLGIETLDQLKERQALVSHLLQAAWDTLTGKRILTKVDADGRGYDNPVFFPDHKYVGCYFLDLSAREDNKVARVRRTVKAWECPVSGKLLDTLFRGISPMITGELSGRLIEKYRCTGAPIEMPVMPREREEVEGWLMQDSAIQILKERGFWTDRFKYVYRKEPSYIAAEHSAQQSRVRLREYTEAFKLPEPGINVLQCSTTMEMGVDIGDIDIVLMDTIPPTAANYLQRAGRAGRNRQSRALAFSLCNNTPVSQQAFANPMWALQTPNHMSPVAPSRTITQRHVNSYFFRKFICDNGQGIDATYTVGDFMRSVCNSFIEFLDVMGGNNAAKAHFKQTFGSGAVFSIDRTREDILGIQRRYDGIIADLEDAFSQYEDDVRRQLAIANQIRKVKSENLLNFLSEQQFIPNASMPTGVVTFDFMDLKQASQLRRLYQKVDQLTARIADAEASEKLVLEQELNKVYRDIQDLRASATASREINTALNEYAPGQTVVVNEKNYRSAGLLLFGAYNENTQTKAIYRCDNCGMIEYRHDLDENRHCPRCGAPYRGIIDENHEGFTQAFEPVGFRTDQNANSTREEKTDKRYYDIQPILLTVDWSQYTEINMCQIAGSGETGKILYYNRGDRFGFAFCKRCGRAAVETDLYSQAPPAELAIGHKRLWGDPCDANPKDIARHVVFTGTHYTCYSVLKFQEDPQASGFVKDKTLVYSLGVILKRALVEYLGIDSTEIGFGIKQEADAFLLFIYDTARGGCGYSTHLTNATECQAVFNIALRKLHEYSCRCHEDGGACARCLIDRENYRFSAFLSKSAAMEWLTLQKERANEVPASIRATHPDAGVVFQPLKTIVARAISNQETTDIVLCASDLNGDCAVSEWTSIHSEMGRFIKKAVERGVKVTIAIEYHPELHSSLVDRIPYLGLRDKFPDCTVKFVSDMGPLKTALISSSASHVLHYFTDHEDVLPFSEEWGNACSRLYAESQAPVLTEIDAPSYPVQSSEIIRQGLATASRFRVGQYFSEVIAKSVLRREDIDSLSSLLCGKNVDITFSDMYVNSALASLMLVYLIKEMRDLFGFSIKTLTLQLDSPRRRCQNYAFSDNSVINYNWENASDADAYTDELCENVLGITPTHSSQDADHHRWLRIETEDGGKVEIRPDHGISGGYHSYFHYVDLDNLDDQVMVFRNNEDVLYYIIIKSR